MGGKGGSREAARLDDHPKGPRAREPRSGEPIRSPEWGCPSEPRHAASLERAPVIYIYILGKYIASLAVPTYDDDDYLSILAGSSQKKLSH